MSLRIYVDAYSGHQANERPARFHLDDVTYDVADIEERWRQPNGDYFKVRTANAKRYVLRHEPHTGEWTLQSGFDAAELLARPNTTLIPVDAVAIVEAESRIAGCEYCRPSESALPFNWILADVLDKDGPYEFAMVESAHCPNCKRAVTEKTLIEPHGGIEVEISA